MDEKSTTAPALQASAPSVTTEQAAPTTASTGAVVPAPAGPAAAAAATATDGVIDITQFAAVKLRVAQIKSVEKVEKSNKLYRIQVDVGPLGTRQIVSGIAKFYTPEQLLGRKIIIVANLKPVLLMGVESHGMLLAASSEDRTQLSLLTPADDVPVGSAVS